MAAKRPLPGFRFEAAPSAPADTLPRMDVAVFVGFAASGPLHRPVPVEDAAQFADLFGDDLPLVWDPARGETVYAYLGPAVRAFFRNGGRRCWVVRVAAPAAESEALESTDLERNGLERFDASLFLDPRLTELGLETLLNTADFLRYQKDPPETLTGIYAALDVEEATLIAVPDAIHLGWERANLPARLSPTELSPLERPEWWHFLPCDPPPKIESVREPQRGEFLDCDLRMISKPGLSVSDAVDVDGTFTLTWTWSGREPGDPDEVFILEEATRSDFADAAPIYQGRATSFTLYGRAPGEYYYRVRVLIGQQTSDWSLGLGVRVAAPRGWYMQPAQHYDPSVLLAVHRALLRMCTARGDLLAVLTLPEHYREAEAIQHIERLKSPHDHDIRLTRDEAASLPEQPVYSHALGMGEARAFSFGAVYHPWLIGRDEHDPTLFRGTPPDGAACGILARRARERGAWVAPANVALDRVVALIPPIARGRWQDLQDAQLNLIRQEPRGFMALNADTLSDDPDLRLINVRRLLILLRRLALRLGATYVFEPHDEDFRRRVQRGFEALLEQMFARGAFAGRVATRAFQVIADERLNPPQSVDQGRFVVELKVAPSLPLHFLTIRLLQTHVGATAQESP